MNKLNPIPFFQKLLKELFIPTHLLTNPQKCIPAEIDLGLRKKLFEIDNYARYLKNTFSKVNERTIYRFFDEYDCHYVFLKVSKKENTYFFVGPYLTGIPERQRLEQIATRVKYANAFDFLTKYYSALPNVEDENLILSFVSALGKEIWQTEKDFSMEYVDYAIPDTHAPVENFFVTKSVDENNFDLQQLEKNYNNEKLLMEAVSSGQLHRLTALASSVYNNGAEQRLPDSLRDRKNYLIILKTLLRKAAENGGVHPLHVHKLSAEFAAEIENLRTIKQSLSLQENMIRSYCLLVKQFSLKNYSLYVSQAITLIQYDLTAELTLSSIASKLSVNASYLSDLFRREYGCTLTEYIGKERTNYAIHLLQNTKKTVQEIASLCGIYDHSYFTKLFKKHVGMTPNQYKQSVWKK